MQPNNNQQLPAQPVQPVNQQVIAPAPDPQQAIAQPITTTQPQTQSAPATQNQAETKKPTNPASAQNSLLFSEMRENMIVMNDGSFRAIIRCQSINFDLMSSREREGVEFSYQNFLNSLYFPVQVLIRSRRVDIGPYIDRLIEIRRSQDNMLLNVLMDDYINFIDILAQEANIMDKDFFIVIPYYPSGDLAEIKKQAKGLFDSFFGGKKEVAVTKINQATYEKAKDEIKNRIDAVMSGLFQMGVKSEQLSTQDISQLFYGSYNPDTASRQPLGDTSNNNLSSTYIRKGDDSTLLAGGENG